MPNCPTSHACTFDNCNATFNRRWKLENHVKLHENLRPFVCSYDGCDKSYTWLQHLKRHEQTHETLKIFICTKSNCDETFATRNNLKRHVENIHLKKKTKEYKCSHCDKQFTKHCWLVQHEAKQHTGLMPYVCTHPDCGKRFIFPNKLRRHMKLHEGYPCTKPNCNKVFSKWTLYRKHLQVAHPIIHKCEYCDRQFCRLYNYRTHMSMHELSREPDYKCPKPNCERFYFAEKNLIDHIRCYHENRPFICDDANCGKTFKTEEDMKRHFKWQHDPNAPPRKKKKRPSLAAKLSGIVPKNKKVVKSQTESTSDKICTSTEQTVNVAENSDESLHKEHPISDEIQNLLNMIDENAVRAAKLKVEYVPLCEFIKA